MKRLLALGAALAALSVSPAMAECGIAGRLRPDPGQ